MFKPLSDIVLVAVTLVMDPTTQKLELKYNPLDYYSTFAECYLEEKKLTKRNTDNRKAYVCVRVDKN